MTTVQETKDALEAEQARAIEIAEKAIGSIDTLLGLSTWVIGILAFVVGIIAIFGYGVIASSAKKSARDIAKTGLDDYLKGKEFEEKLELAIGQEVRDRMKDKIIMNYMASPKDVNGEPDAFPSAPGNAGK